MKTKNKSRSAIILTIVASSLILSGCTTSPSSGSGTKKVDDSVVVKEKEKLAPALGTRQNPVPTGTKVEVGPNWRVSVLSVTPNATDTVLATNQFNESPALGRQFVMTKVQTSYSGAESGTPSISLSMKYLGSDGNSYGYGSDDYCGVIPTPFIEIGEQFPGATSEGNVCWSIPSSAISGGTIIIEEMLSATNSRVFFEGAK